jgi:glycosyltransferase involved in cell wall biosynthesis
MDDVTLVITTCDRPYWLDACLESLPDVRRIVVDDSSQGYNFDRNRGVAERRGAEYVRSEHIGTSAARMLGLALVTSEFFAFFDDDDVMLPDWLPLHLDAIKGADVVSSAHYETDAFLGHPQLRRMAPTSMADLLKCHVTISDNSLIRRSALKGVTWHPERQHVMMLSLWLALMDKGARFVMLDTPTWMYRIHGANITPTTRDEQDAAFRREAIAEYA